MKELNEFVKLARQAGAIDLVRVVASAKTAIIYGESPQYVLDSLRKHCPYLFNK